MSYTDKKFSLVFAFLVVILIGVGTTYFAQSLLQKPTFHFVPVKEKTVTQGVVKTGTVKASQDISLSFQSSGTIGRISVVAGQKVKRGQVLMALNNTSVSASINQARAAIESARANYQKVLNGSTSAQISLAKTQVDTANTSLSNAQKNYTAVKNQQDQLVKNAYNAMLSSNLVALPGSTLTTIVPTVTGTYT